MAKKLKAGEFVTLDFSAIHHFHADNSRKASFDNPLSDLDFAFASPDQFSDKENKNKGLVRAMFNGWDSSQGVMKIITIESFANLYGITVEEVLQKVREEREEQIRTWEASENTKGLANVAKMVWFPGGKPVEVLAIGNENYRRTYAIMGVVYKRTLSPSYEGDLTYSVPGVVTNFSSTLEKWTSHVQENTGKDVGRSEYAPLDYLLQAQQCVALLGNESSLVKAGIKRGTAQKVFRLATLNQKYPDVKIIERCFATPPATGVLTEYTKDCYIPLSRIDKEEVQNLLNGFRSKGKVKNEADAEILTDDDIHAWLADVVTGKVAATRSMSGSEIGKLADKATIFVQDIAKAIGKNDSQFFANVDKFHKELNEVWLSIREKVLKN